MSAKRSPRCWRWSSAGPTWPLPSERRPIPSRSDMTSPDVEELADRAAPLDALLVDAALGPLRRLAPNLSTVRLAAGLVRRPVTTGRRLGGLAAELARIGVGTSTVEASKRDRRFADPAWSQNP